MHDHENIVAALKSLRDTARKIDESSTMSYLIGMALHEATVLAWDSVMRDPDEKRRAARFFRLYAIMPKD